MLQDPYTATAIGVCGIIGAYSVAKATLGVMGSFKRDFLRGTYNMYDRYGKKGSWVVVTGGSDGIGLEICQQMA